MEKIEKLIIETFYESFKDIVEDEINNETPIFGGSGKLDSLDLVAFLVNLEQKIEDEFSQSLTIADEKAMSLKNSPFRTIRTLADFLNSRINSV